MQIKRFPLGMPWTNCYLIWDGENNGFVVDPAGSARPVVHCTDANGIKPELVLLTHRHTPHHHGHNRRDYSFLKPYVKNVTGKVTPGAIQSAIDVIEQVAGGSIDFIVAAFDARRQYVDFLTENRTNLDYMNLDGGYKALSYAGIPFVADRFAADGPGYPPTSEDFKLPQLCDCPWRAAESGHVLHHLSVTASYSPPLVP